MKHLFTLKSLLLTLVMLCGLNAWGETATLTFNEACKGSGTDTKGNTWTVTSDAEESSFDNTKGVHYGTSKKAVSYLQLTTTISGTITSIKVNASGASTTSAKLNVTVGGSAFGSQSSISKTATDYTFEGNATGEIVVKLSQTSEKKALYVKSIEVTYTTAGGGEVASIAIEGEASKTLYEAGETFSTSGLKVIATRTDGTTSDVTGDVAWTFDPETLAVGTTTVKITAKYQKKTASKDINVTVVAKMPTVTLDLSTPAQIKGKATADLLEYDANVLTVTSERTDSKRNPVNNYYPGSGETSTRFYTGNSLTFTPAANFEIVSITYNATSEKYATALATSTWTNASATADVKTVTITPVDGTKPFSATIGGTTGAISMVIKYRVKTVTGLDAVLDAAHAGNVGGQYRINCALRVNYKDAKYAYASTIGGGSTKTAPTEAQKEEWWSDVEKNFNQNDWVAIQNSGLELGDEIEAGSVVTLVSNDAFPVVEFDSMNSKLVTAIAANTYRVANFVDSDNELVKKLWLVDPQPAEHCFVKGYVANLGDIIEVDGVFVAEIKSGDKDVVTMYVNYKTTDFSITTPGWYRFEGVVVNGTSGLELNAVKMNEGTATGVEGVETSSVKVYGAEGVINVESEEVAPIAVYSANGAIVSSVEASSASIAVAPGFYIVKAGNSVSKVTVK